MEAIFLKLFNMSITASWLILVVIVLRIVMKKVPKYMHCILWGIVAFKLICPVSFESMWSFVPSREPISTDILYEPNVPPVQSNIPIVDEVVNEMITPIIYDTFTPVIDNESIIDSESIQDNMNDESNGALVVNPMQLFLQWSSIVWMLGIAVMLIFNAVSYLRIYYEVKFSMRLSENIWLCDNIDTPFVLGFFRPQIYLPSNISEEQIAHVVAHEKAHIKRRDHWWKPLGFLILSVYWFNPFIWIAYILLCRDIELACDERVVKTMGVEEKKAYSETLLACSISRHMVMACPLAFGEVGVKMRIKSVLNYKKPSFWVMMVAIITCVVVAVGFLTSQKPKEEKAIGELFADMNKVHITCVEVPEWILDENGDGSFKEKTTGAHLADVPEKQEKIKQILNKYCYYVNTKKESTSKDDDGATTLLMISYGDTREEVIIVSLIDSRDEISISISFGPSYVYKLKGKGSASNMIQEILTVLKEEPQQEELKDTNSEVEENGPTGVHMLSTLLYDSESGTSYANEDNAPFYQFYHYAGSNNFALQSCAIGENQWNLIGRVMEEIILTEENFDARFKESGIWAQNYSISEIRQNNEKAWQVKLTEGDLSNQFYLLLEQKNGEFLLAHGYYHVKGYSAVNEDSSFINWMYDLEMITSDQNSSLENSFLAPSVTEKMNGNQVSYEEAKELVKNIGAFRLGYTTYRDQTIQGTCSEIEEVLSVYFSCFFHPELWGNYTFIDDVVLKRWNHLYESAFGQGVELARKEGVNISYVYYKDEENYFIEVLHPGETIRDMHLKKIENEWYVVEDVQGDYYGGHYSEEEKMKAMEMRMEALQLGRKKNPLTETLIQQGIDAALELYRGDAFGLTEEEFIQMKQQIEGIYNAEWCDQMLVQYISSYTGWVPKLDEDTVFMVWVQPKENYDKSVEDILNGIFGTEDNRGYYVIVTYKDGNWKTDMIVFEKLPLPNDLKW